MPADKVSSYSICNHRIYLIASGGNSCSWSSPGYTGSGSIVYRTPPVVGTYTITNSGGCTASASVTISCGGSEKNAGDFAMQTLMAFPNPANGVSTISFMGHGQEQVQLSVFSIAGRAVAEFFNEQTEMDRSCQFAFDTSNLPEGIYYAVLQRSGGDTERLPVMVVK